MDHQPGPTDRTLVGIHPLQVAHTRDAEDMPAVEPDGDVVHRQADRAQVVVELGHDREKRVRQCRPDGCVEGAGRDGRDDG